MTLALLLLQLIVCAAIVGRAGFELSATADRLAQAHGWGRGWVGLALLATVTSLPELASGLSAVALVGSADLAVGNALGACVFNLAFLVVVDAHERQRPIYLHAGAIHLLSAAFAVVMPGFVAMSLLAGPNAPALLHVGVYSPALLALYLVALRSVHEREQVALAAREPARADADATTALEAGSATGAVPPGPLRAVWGRFAAAAGAVVAAGLWLPYIAQGLSGALALERSVVGTLLMAAVTTLPEMAVTLSALRLRALDLAIGNLLGSTLFNIAILAVDDLFYRPGPLLADAAPVHVATAVATATMAGLVVVGLALRATGRVLRVVGWTSVGLAAVYVVNALLVVIAAA